MTNYSQITLTLAMTILAACGPSLAPACTGITLKPKDGSIIFARTLEFAMDLQSDIIIVPRGKESVGTAPGDRPGLRWRTKYGAVGANAFGMPVTIDGLNDKGLSVGLFYFPGFAKYQEVKAEDFGKALAPWELGAFLLGTCADVKEAVAAAKTVRVGEVVQKDMGIVPPAHYIVNDANGGSVVLEYVGGELQVHANPLGVMSNSPTFDWHMTNLSNYVTMSAANVEKIDLAGKEIKGLGQGSGMLGLPGDFTPPSRFVRAVAFTKSAVPVDNAREGVLQAFHLLNQFDIGRVYLPGEDCRRFGYSDDDLKARVTNAPFLELMKFEVDRARQWLAPWRDKSLPELRVLPFRLQVDIELFARGGETILDRIAGIGYRVWDKRPVVTKRDAARLFIGCAWRALWRNVGLGQ